MDLAPRQLPTSRHSRLLAAVLSLCMLHAAAYAAEPRADDMERAEAKVIEAKAFFKGGLFPQAATSYLQAFAISHKPATLFNAARAYEEGKHYAESIALFEQYRQQPDTPADGKREANERIAHDRAQLAAAGEAAKHVKVPATAPAEVKPPEPKPAETKPAVAAAPQAKTEMKKPAAETDVKAESTKSNWLDWALFSVGDTLVLVGLLGYAGAISSVNQANTMDFSALNAYDNYNSQIKRARDGRTGAAIIGVVGAGIAGWGAWRLWGPKHDATAPGQDKPVGWLIPTVTPDTAGVAWGGRF